MDMFEYMLHGTRFEPNTTLRQLTVLTQRHIEQSVWRAWRTRRTEAHILRIPIDRREHIQFRRKPIAGHATLRVHLLVKVQRQHAAQILLEHVQRRVLGDVRRKDGTIAAVQTVALFGAPVRQMRAPVVALDDAILCDIVDAREDCHTIGGRAVLAVHQAELFVR